MVVLYSEYGRNSVEFQNFSWNDKCARSKFSLFVCQSLDIEHRKKKDVEFKSQEFHNHRVPISKFMVRHCERILSESDLFFLCPLPSAVVVVDISSNFRLFSEKKEHPRQPNLTQ
jgi:hypothetical protein